MKKAFTLLLLAALCINAFAQWKPTNGLFAGAIHSIIKSNNEIIVGTNQIYKSANNGKTWSVSNNGITGSVTAIRGLAKSGTYLVAATDVGAYYSTDNGNNWTPSPGTSALNIWCLTVKGTDTLFMSTDANGIYKSVDHGISWTAKNTGINMSPALDIRGLAVKGHDIYAGSDGYGIYKSTNQGTSWSLVNIGLPGSYYGVNSMAVSGTTIYAGTYGAGMYKSIDNGGTWATVNNGLPGNYYAVSSLAVVGTNILFGTYGAGIYRSVNDGGLWTAVNNGVSSSEDILAMGVNGTTIYASTLSGSLLQTTNYTNWSGVSIPTYTSTRFESFFSSGGVFYVGAWGYGAPEKSYGLYRTADNGATWQQIGITDYPVSVLEVSGGNILAGTNDITGNSGRVSFFKTTEVDTTWTYNLGGLATDNVTALKGNGSGIMYLFNDESTGSILYRSINNGLNWTSTGYNAQVYDIVSIAFAGTNIYLGDNSPYYSSSHVFKFR
ncbi:MAG: sialidase family protein [Bacteroidota bacterium]